MQTLKTPHISLIVFCLFVLGCTESYELKSKNSESSLVVEATITDELKFQEIKLSKTYSLESDEPNNVSNAQVWVETNNGIQMNFQETEPGLYISEQEFQALEGESYIMHAILNDGSSYISSPEVLPPTSEINSLETALQSVNGVEGVQVYVNNDNPNNALYFKYEYEETYKTVVPFYNIFDLEIINEMTTPEEGLTYDLILVPKEQDLSTCYSTQYSTEIIQTSLNDSQNNVVVQFPVRFIRSDDGILRDRYSILVKQQVQSLEAYTFYKTLKELGTIDNAFANNQPGFIQGNITSQDNIEENVIGFFQVTSVSTKRIFFNYEDFNIERPPFIFECTFQIDVDYNDNTTLDEDRNDRLFLYNVLNQGSYAYFEGDFPIYSLVSTQCANCTSYSSTEIPEFWEE